MPLPIGQVPEIQLVCEMDEQWSFVQNKACQRWLWYAWSPQHKRIFAYTLGARTDETCQQLLDLLKPFDIKVYCTDDWGAYSRLLPSNQHITGKKYTQRIERQNLNVRTHIKRLTRKTICFSKSIELHDKVIGEYIRRHWLQPV